MFTQWLVIFTALVCGALANKPTCGDLARAAVPDYSKFNGRWLVQDVLILNGATDDGDVRTYDSLPDDPVTSTMVCHRDDWTNVASTGQGKKARGTGHHQVFVRTVSRNLTYDFTAESTASEDGTLSYSVKKEKKVEGIILEFDENAQHHMVIVLCAKEQNVSKPAKILLKSRAAMTTEQTAPIWQRIKNTLQLDAAALNNIWHMGTYCL